MFRVWIATLAVASALAAQPKFDVVSIRPTQRLMIGGPSPYLPGGNFNDPGALLLFLIVMAYDIPQERQLVGLPEWTQRSSYSIQAKAAADFPALPPAENEAQIKLMLRSMLEDRFKLRFHIETREENVLTMRLDRGGLKVKEVAAPVPSEQPGNTSAAMGDRGGGISGKKITMARLASTVSLFLRQDVVDQTGLSGYYDLALRWDAPRVEGTPLPAASLGPEGIALFVSALRSELGLQLTNGKGPVRYWVVDSVERPSEN